MATTPGAVRHLWTHETQDHPWLPHEELVIDHAEGVWVWTKLGKKLMDGFAGLAVVKRPPRRREVAEANAEQTVKLAYYPTTRQLSNRHAAQPAAKLASLTPGDLDLTMFAVSDSEANERSMQIVRHYWMAPRQGGGRNALPEGLEPRRDRLPARQRAAPGATPLHRPRRGRHARRHRRVLDPRPRARDGAPTLLSRADDLPIAD